MPESTLLAVFWLLFSACVGSFITMLVHRLPLMLEAQEAGQAPPVTLNHPASHCPVCKHRLGLLENIPLLGWLLARGHCRHCGTSIPARYLLLEVLSVLWAAWVLWSVPGGWVPVVAWSVFGWILLAAAWMDARTMWLPDVLTLSLLWAGLLFAGRPGSHVSAEDAIFSAVAGWLVLEGLARAYEGLRGRQGLGGGDVKLVAALGAWLGWRWLPYLMLLACALFLVQVVLTRLTSRESEGNGAPAPLGPSLCAAGLALHLAYPWLLMHA